MFILYLTAAVGYLLAVFAVASFALALVRGVK